MLPSNLPTSLTQWRRYFDVTFKFIEEVCPTISLGSNKIDLILTNLQVFRTSFLKDHQPTVTSRESWILFEFFKTCAAFISYCSQYSSKKLLSYLISHPINGQYNELAELFISWSVQSSMLLCNSFQDLSLLSYAHYLDLIAIRDSFSPVIDTFPDQISCALKKKLDSISKLLTIPSQTLQNPNSRIFENSQIIKGEKINKNEFSQFFKAKLKDSGTEIVIVEFPKSDLSDKQILDFKNNLNSYFNFDHPNIISFKGSTSSPPCTIILNNLIQGNLYDLLQRGEENDDKQLLPSQKLKIALGIIRGLEYFNSMKFVHQDLKSENILLGSNYNAFISSFPNEANHENERCDWISPEILSGQTQNVTSASDIYSYGIILWELLTGEKPYENLEQTQTQIAESIIDKNLRPNIPTNATKEITDIIQGCLSPNPKDRPSAASIRHAFEGKGLSSTHVKFYSNDDISEFVKWSNETRSAHEAIILKISDETRAKETNLIQKLAEMSQPDSPFVLHALRELRRYDKSCIPTLINVLLKLVNQNIDASVRKEAFEFMKEIVARDDIVTIIDLNEFVDKIAQIAGNQPKYMIQMAKIIAPRLDNINLLVNKFVAMQKTHYNLEIIKVIISEKSSLIGAKNAVKIFESVPDELSGNFLRFLLDVYGPILTFFHPSCRSLQLISIFFDSLSSYCADYSNIQKVKDMINVDEISTLSEIALRKVLKSVSKVVVIKNMNDVPLISREMALIMFYFIAQYCIILNQTKTALFIINMCILVPSMRREISQSTVDVWGAIIKAINNSSNEIAEKVDQKSSSAPVQKPTRKSSATGQKIERKNSTVFQKVDDELSLALRIIEEIPVDIETAKWHKLWNAIVMKYRMTKNKSVSKTICSILTRKKTFDANCPCIRLLFPTINEGIASDDDNFSLTSLKILRHIDISAIGQFLTTSASAMFWPSLTKQMKKQNGKICKSIGKLVVKMIENMPNFQLDPSFLQSVIELIYNKMTSFDTSMPFIIFLGDASKIREVVLFLQRKSFVRYLQQLLWRYENDPRVPGVVDYFASSLKQNYSQM